MRNIFSSVIIFCFALLTGCSDKEPSTEVRLSDVPYSNDKKFFVLGVHPLHSPSKLVSVYGPLADYLTSQLNNIEIQVEASEDYSNYEDKIAAQRFDFILPNPFQTINSYDNYRVINQIGRQEVFKGLILVRKDSGIENVSELEGSAISYPAPTALAATMLPQMFLQTHGLDLTKVNNLYVGSQESSIMHVYLGHSRAASTWTIPWLDMQKNKPEIAKDLKVAWETQTLPSNSFMYNVHTVSEETAKRIQRLLANLHTHSQGKAILERMNVQYVLFANNETYKPVVDFIKQFKEQVGDNTVLPQRREVNNAQ